MEDGSEDGPEVGVVLGWILAGQWSKVAVYAGMPKQILVSRKMSPKAMARVFRIALSIALLKDKQRISLEELTNH